MLKDRLFDALARSDADYTDIRFEAIDATAIAYRGEEAERVSSSKMTGGVVRACTKGGWGITTFEAIDELEYYVEETARCAALVGEEEGETTALAEVAPAAAVIRAELANDFRGVSLDEKLALVMRYNDIILKAGDAIETSTVAYADSFRTVEFASSRGTHFLEERPKVKLNLSATARDGSLVQQARDGCASATTFDVVRDREVLAERIARRAAALLVAPPCPAGQRTVILDPELAGVFVHEAFGHLSEADFLYENPQMRDLMVIGREMGGKDLNVVDDGSMGRLIGTQRFDDEGTPTGKAELIRDGVLAGHLHSLETAGKMEGRATGNARAIGIGCAPIVRMTNTYIENGDRTFEELLRDVDDGIYACGMLGGQTMMEMFTFSAAYGYEIKNGRKGDLLRDVMLTGNVFATLHAIDGFGNDLQMFEKGGGCGKGEQFPLPVTFGSPHLCIRDVVIGGR